MAIFREGQLSGVNDIYAQMLEARTKKFPCPKCGEKCAPCKESGKCSCGCGKKFTPKVEKLSEGVTSSNSIHGEVEEYMDEFISSIQQAVDADATEAKLADLEKIDLTGGDKKIIGAIRKFVSAVKKANDDFQSFKDNLKYEFVVTKKPQPESPSPEEAEAELRGADDEMKDGLKADEVAVPAEDKE